MDTQSTQKNRSAQSTQDAQDVPDVQDTQGTPEDPAVVAARVRRRLFMGAALFLALASIYAGLLGVPQAIELALSVVAVVCLIVGLRSTPSRPSR